MNKVPVKLVTVLSFQTKTAMLLAQTKSSYLQVIQTLAIVCKLPTKLVRRYQAQVVQVPYGTS